MDRASIDQLYSAPLSDFVTVRDRLVKEAKAAGDKDLAAEIKALKKPPVPAWVLNQLAREDDLAEWVGAVDELRAAQIGLLSGKSTPDAVREAQQIEREAMVALREAASKLLEAGDHNASIATLERVVRTFRGAAMNPEARDALIEGRLTEEHEEPGFDALIAGMPGGTFTPRPRPEKPKAKAEPAPKRKLAAVPDPEDRRSIERRKKLLALRDELKEARDERLQARAEAGRSTTAADRARKALEEAEERLKQAETEEKAAAKALEKIEEKVAKLEEKIEELEA